MHIIIFPCHPSPSIPFHTSKWHRASHQGKLFRKLSSFSIEACGGGDNGRVARTSDILMQRHLCRSESGDFGVCQTPPHLFPLSPNKPEPDMHPFFKEDDTGRQGLYLNFWFFFLFVVSLCTSVPTMLFPFGALDGDIFYRESVSVCETRGGNANKSNDSVTGTIPPPRNQGWLRWIMVSLVGVGSPEMTNRRLPVKSGRNLIMITHRLVWCKMVPLPFDSCQFWQTVRYLSVDPPRDDRMGNDERQRC